MQKDPVYCTDDIAGKCKDLQSQPGLTANPTNPPVFTLGALNGQVIVEGIIAKKQSMWTVMLSCSSQVTLLLLTVILLIGFSLQGEVCGCLGYLENLALRRCWKEGRSELQPGNSLPEAVG